MKTSLNNIIIGDIYICTHKLEHVDDYNNVTASYKGKPCEENVLLVKDKFGSYIRFEDLKDSGSLALSLYGAAIRFAAKPTKLKQKYISHTKPLFPDATDENIPIKDIVSIVNDYINACEI